MNSRHQIFISSTFEDLEKQREAVVKAILKIGDLPVGMEMFNAADEDQWTHIKRNIDQSDYYVVLSARRYGTLYKKKISYTEREYDYAVSKGIPTLGFILKDGAAWSNDSKHCDRQHQKRLAKFQGKIKSKMVYFWSNTDELTREVVLALMETKQTKPRPGWVRADKTPNPEQVANLIEEVARLNRENSELKVKASDESVFSLIDSMAGDPETQAVIYMYETQKVLPAFSPYVYGRIDRLQGTGQLGGFNSGNLVNCGIIRQVGGGGYWSLTPEGEKFAQWLISKNRKCAFFVTYNGGWGKIPSDAMSYVERGGFPPSVIEQFFHAPPEKVSLDPSSPQGRPTPE